MVSTPVMIQATSKPPAEPVCREISADTMKIPEPIIDPTTIMVESNNPRPRTKPESDVGGGHCGGAGWGHVKSQAIKSAEAVTTMRVPHAGLSCSPYRLPAQRARFASLRNARARWPGFSAAIRSRATARESAPAR